jgi:hypothetical protein
MSFIYFLQAFHELSLFIILIGTSFARKKFRQGSGGGGTTPNTNTTTTTTSEEQMEEEEEEQQEVKTVVKETNLPPSSTPSPYSMDNAAEQQHIAKKKRAMFQVLGGFFKGKSGIICEKK